MSTNEIETELVTRILNDVFQTQVEPGSWADQFARKNFRVGLEKGLEEGELIGKIQLLQELLGVVVSSRQELLTRSLAELSAMKTDLQKRMRDRDHS